MPIYEYQCSDCGRRIERLQRVNDPPPPDCECGGSMHRQVSAPAFQFKGSGWYVTDYADRKSSAEGDGKEKDTSSGKSSDGSSAKDAPAAKAGDSAASGTTSASKPGASGEAG